MKIREPVIGGDPDGGHGGGDHVHVPVLVLAQTASNLR